VQFGAKPVNSLGWRAEWCSSPEWQPPRQALHWRSRLLSLSWRDSAEHTRSQLRSAYSGALEDSSTTAARRRQASLFEALNVRAPLDTSVIAQAGDLLAYTDFQVLHLSTSQVVVLARDDHGSVLLTNWIGSGAEWRAIGMVLNPSPAALDRLYERATEWSGR
jgi:hypothetical protein